VRWGPADANTTTDRDRPPASPRCHRCRATALASATIFRTTLEVSLPAPDRFVDFACPAAKLAVELDGGQHAERIDQDAERSVELAQQGYRVIRFWNFEVTENLDGVIQAILLAVEAAPPHPDPVRPQWRKGNVEAP
jgi:very-short-patch-repair endonuclease